MPVAPPHAAPYKCKPVILPLATPSFIIFFLDCLHTNLFIYTFSDRPLDRASVCVWVCMVCGVWVCVCVLTPTRIFKDRRQIGKRQIWNRYRYRETGSSNRLLHRSKIFFWCVFHKWNWKVLNKKGSATNQKSKSQSKGKEKSEKNKKQRVKCKYNICQSCELQKHKQKLQTTQK